MDQNQQTKLTLGIVIVVIVLAALYYFVFMRGVAEAPTAEGLQATTTLPSGEARSDEALDADMGAIDAQMQALDGDSAEVDSAIEAGKLIPN